MKRFIQDPLKVFLSSIGILFIACLLFLSSCGSQKTEMQSAIETKKATHVVNHNVKNIIVETLHDGRDFDSGIFKVTIDNVEYVVVSNYGSGTAIIKHEK
jgi:hypothetical protein